MLTNNLKVKKKKINTIKYKYIHLFTDKKKEKTMTNISHPLPPVYA